MSSQFHPKRIICFALCNYFWLYSTILFLIFETKKALNVNFSNQRDPVESASL